jgi:hypothetical protein
MLEREMIRYAAYFKGWCQAFGEHEGVRSRDSGIEWLLADHQLGLVLPVDTVKSLRREVLLQRLTPSLTFRRNRIEVGSLRIPLKSRQDASALDAIREILASPEAVHLFLTSHLLYGGGNRIITFSNKKPLPIIYKVIGTMHVRIDRV